MGLDPEDVPGLPDEVEVYVRTPTKDDQLAYERKVQHSSLAPTPPQEQALIRAKVNGTTHDFYLLGNDVTHTDAFEETHFPVWPPRERSTTPTLPSKPEESITAWLRDFQRSTLRNTTVWVVLHRGRTGSLEFGVGIPALEDAKEWVADQAVETLIDLLPEGTLPKGLEGTRFTGSEIQFSIQLPFFIEHKEEILQALAAFDALAEDIPDASNNAKVLRRTLHGMRSAVHRYSSRLVVTQIVQDSDREFWLDLFTPDFKRVDFLQSRQLLQRLDRELKPLFASTTSGALKLRRLEETSDADGWDFRLCFSPGKALPILGTLAKDDGFMTAFVSIIEGALEDSK